MFWNMGFGWWGGVHLWKASHGMTGADGNWITFMAFQRGWGDSHGFLEKGKVRRFSFVYLYLDDLYLPIGARVLCLESHRFGEMSVVH